MINYTYENDKIKFRVKSSFEELYLIGSFTSWLMDEKFKMEKFGEEFIIEKPFHELNKIANSGYIEYYFGNKDGKLKFDMDYKKGYYFNNQANKDYNYLLLPKTIDENKLNEIYENSLASFKIKGNPEDFKNYFELTNFREVLGGDLGHKKLFRSYHPLIPSRSNNDELRDIEITRQNILRDLLEKYSINNVINLSETKEELADFLEDTPPYYYKTLYNNGRIHNVPMSYETVYFMSSENTSFKKGELGFQDGIKSIINYIAFNEGPFLVHCRLGSDRTGVVIGFLQLFMRVNKEDIRENYLKTNDLGIGEFRSFNLLEFSLKSAFGEDCFEKNRVDETLISWGLTRDIVEKAYEKLKS